MADTLKTLIKQSGEAAAATQRWINAGKPDKGKTKKKMEQTQRALDVARLNYNEAEYIGTLLGCLLMSLIVLILGHFFSLFH